jgi:hypothetical protein
LRENGRSQICVADFLLEFCCAKLHAGGRLTPGVSAGTEQLPQRGNCFRSFADGKTPCLNPQALSKGVEGCGAATAQAGAEAIAEPRKARFPAQPEMRPNFKKSS